MIYKTLHRKLSNTTKLVTSEGELRCFRMVSTSYSTIDTRRVAVVPHCEPKTNLKLQINDTFNVQLIHVVQSSMSQFMSNMSRMLYN
jgi:hypothetical protein